MRWLGVGLLAIVCACSATPPGQSEAAYDLVILNGRVMDPATGLDAPRAVGISRGTIRAISDQALPGRETLDARGMVVAPGFIDLHQHAQDAAGYQVAVLDGTTTALELEGGTADVDRWYDERKTGSLINHGVSIGHDQVRMAVMADPGKESPIGPAKSRASTEAELVAIVAALERGFRRGAIAAGLLIAPSRFPGRAIRGPVQ